LFIDKVNLGEKKFVLCGTLHVAFGSYTWWWPSQFWQIVLNWWKAKFKILLI